MRARLAASAALAVLVTAALAGCVFVTPQVTTRYYEPADGVSTTVGVVKVLNVIAIVGDTQRTNADANLVFTAVNSSESDVTLRVQYRSGERKRNRTIDLQPGINKVGYDEKQLLLTGFRQRPGSLAQIYFQYGNKQGQQLPVPVLDSSWAIYDGLAPTPSPTPTPTSTNPPVLPAPIPSPSATG